MHFTFSIPFYISLGYLGHEITPSRKVQAYFGSALGFLSTNKQAELQLIWAELRVRPGHGIYWCGDQLPPHVFLVNTAHNCRLSAGKKTSKKQMFFMVINQQSFHSKCQTCTVLFAWMDFPALHLQHLSFTLARCCANVLIAAKIIRTFYFPVTAPNCCLWWVNHVLTVRTTGIKRGGKSVTQSKCFPFSFCIP